VEAKALRMLMIHADRFEWEVTQRARVSVSDPLTDENRRGTFTDCLVVFVAVEKVDERDLEAAASLATDSISEVIGRLGVEIVVLYPYAHLSTELGSPRAAMRALELLEEKLRGKGLKAHRSPFGYYKRFLLECKGHPLAESFREIRI
jgi:threonyl-tRNA synthetase